MFGVVDDTTTTKFANLACAVHCISLPVVVDKVVVVVLKFPIFRRLTLGAPVQLSLYKSFRTSSFTIVYVFTEKAVLWMSALQMSGENRNRLESPLGVWTNPVYKISCTSLPAKQALTVGSSSGLTWSCYMIGVILIFQSVCQKNTFAWWFHHVCVTHYVSANQEFVGRQRPQKWTKRVLIAPCLTLSPQSLNPSPFLPSSLSPLDACYAGYGTMLFISSELTKVNTEID